MGGAQGTPPYKVRIADSTFLFKKSKMVQSPNLLSALTINCLSFISCCYIFCGNIFSVPDIYFFRPDISVNFLLFLKISDVPSILQMKLSYGNVSVFVSMCVQVHEGGMELVIIFWWAYYFYECWYGKILQIQF